MRRHAPDVRSVPVGVGPQPQLCLGALLRRLDRLWQLCINAEPNYGTLWFHCKVSVLLTTRQVLHNASKLLNKEVNEWRHVYDAARVRGATPEFKAASEALVAAAAQEPAQPDPRATLPPLVLASYDIECSAGAPDAAGNYAFPNAFKPDHAVRCVAVVATTLGAGGREMHGPRAVQCPPM